MKSQQTKSLRGHVRIPGDKSISHRAVMLGALAKGETIVRGFLPGADCMATIRCFQKLGIPIDVSADPDEAFAGNGEVSPVIRIKGRGLYGLHQSPQPLDTGNSGTTTRLCAGILSGQPFTSVLFGDDSLNSRPMGRIITPLRQMGADISSISGNGCAPLMIRPAALHGIRYDSPVASAQVKSAILLAGLYAQGDTTVTEPSLSRDHTERMLSAFGARITTGMDELHPYSSVHPGSELYGCSIDVPGDISSAAYWIAAASLVPGSELTLTNVGINPSRAGMLEVCRRMGARVEVLRQYTSGSEPVADLLVRSAHLSGTVIDKELIPSLIDEIPVIAVMAACAEGETIIRDAAELKVKETDRIQTICANLSAMGCPVTPTDDGMLIQGGHPLSGAVIDTRGDHRIAMAFAVASLVAAGQTTITDRACVDVSYPGFFQILKKLAED